MKKWLYWAGLPACFIILVGATFLFPKTYESTFVIAKESELSTEQNRVMTLNHPENYDLGVIRTDNRLSSHAYCEILQSYQFLQSLLDMKVSTVDGDFNGTYRTYCTDIMKAPIFLRWMQGGSQSGAEETVSQEGKDASLKLWTQQEEKIIKCLRNSIEAEVDYETDFVSITFTSQDPLVSTMMARNVRDKLLEYVENYQQEKMQIALKQLSELTTQAKVAYEQDPTEEKAQIYKSFARQEIVYKAQMMYHPGFATLSEPSFSYEKVSPSRWKFPLIITLVIGLGMLCWDHRKKIKRYLKSE